MAKHQNLVIDGIVYDQKLSKSIIKLSKKYGYSHKEVAAICSFFNGLMVPEWYKMADLFLNTSKKWNTPPIEILNNGVYLYTSRSERSSIFSN